MAVAIVGCGLIGFKRAAALASGRLRYAVDPDLKRASSLADKYSGCVAVAGMDPVLSDPAVSLVIVATPNHALSKTSLECTRAGKNVLVEKPGGLSSMELRTVLESANASRVRVRIGYNHRFHPAFQRARELVDSGSLGPLMFLRARYGHGGRVGYEKEWRADPRLSGGGELIDQGVHLIDLAQWFLGQFVTVDGHVETSFWEMPVDDNAFMSLRTARGQTAWLHASCTEWKNLFSMEIYGRLGKLSVEGLGGSYGLERLVWYRMLPEMGPPETMAWEFPRGDQSWALEVQDFEKQMSEAFDGNPALEEGIRVLEIVERIYDQSNVAWRNGLQ